MHPHEDRNLGTQVLLTTIDKIVEELQLERVDFIKMDIEGAERKALAGARNTLAERKPRLALAGYHLEDDQTKIPRDRARCPPRLRHAVRALLGERLLDRSRHLIFPVSRAEFRGEPT